MSDSPNNHSIPDKSQVFNFWGKTGLCLALTFALAHLVTVVVNHYFFRTYAYDYAVYNFSFYDYAHFRNSPVPVYLQPYDVKFIQDHFSLSMMVLSPLYWIFCPVFGTYSMLIIQFCMIMVGAWSTFKIVQDRYGSINWAMISVVIYLSIYSRFSAYQNDCNLAIFGSAMVPLFLLLFFRKKYIAALLVFIFLVFNREDFPLGTLFLGIFLFLIVKEKKARLWSITFAVLSIVVFVIDFEVILPALEDEHKKFSLFNYSALGKDPWDALKFIFLHPIEFAGLFFRDMNGQLSQTKIGYYGLLLGSGVLFLLIRPVCLVPLIPLLLKKMLNDDVVRNGYESYYGVEIATILPVLIFLSLEKISIVLVRGLLMGIGLYFLYFTTHKYFVESTDDSATWNKFNPFIFSFYQPGTINPANVHYMISQIEKDAAVSASGRLVPHLAYREEIYYFPEHTVRADYICVFLKMDTWPAGQDEHSARLDKLLRSGEWKILLADEQTILLKRK